MPTSANSGQLFSRDRSRAQHFDPALAHRDHGRFDAVFSRAAIHNERDATRQFLHHMAAAVGLMRPKRFALGAASGRPKARTTSAKSGCALIRTATVSRPAVTIGGTISRRGRTIVRGPGQNFAIKRSISGRSVFIDHRHSLQPFQLRQVDDQRIEMRALFCLENLYHRFGGKGVRRQAVDRLGRQGDDFARPQQIDRPRHRLPAIARRVCRSDLRWSS